jgi:hypothetical protein
LLVYLPHTNLTCLQQQTPKTDMKVRLEVELSSAETIALVPQLKASSQDEDSFFAVTVQRIALLSGEGQGEEGRDGDNDGDEDKKHHAALASVSVTRHNHHQPQQPMYAALFLPATLTESALDGASNFVLASKSSVSVNTTKKPASFQATKNKNRNNTNTPTRQQLSQRLLAMVHPFLAQNVSLHGIIQIRQSEDRHAPADIALVDLQHTPSSLLHELLQTTNGKVVHAGPALVLKVLLIHALHFVSPSVTSTTTETKSNLPPSSSLSSSHLEIPSCPVCLHRIDPLRLGLPAVDTLQLCSKFCTPPNLTPTTIFSNATAAGGNGSTSRTTTSRNNLDHRVACSQQRLLRPWPRPNICQVCQTIDRYWQIQLLGLDTTATTATPTKAVAAGTSHIHESSAPSLRCGSCGMQQTLWVCLTCGFLGCGRYSNKHAAQHFLDSGHAFSLELATLRIWDYVTGGFVQRTDLLECPSSWPLLQPWIAPPMSSPFLRGGGSSDIVMVPPHSSDDLSEKTPKKATMVGEEYEVLLQSALEDQAQHYEGEISQLRAQLTEQHVDRSVMTAAEAAIVDELQTDIANLQVEIDQVSRQLLEAQSQEAEYRATSTRLLRQQQVTQDLVHKLEAEVAHEREVGHHHIEELEQQIADLQANQRMRDQFTHDAELQQAQIWGLSTTTTPTNNSSSTRAKKGKKLRRGRG